MSPQSCPHEAELLETLVSGRWPQASSAELREHVERCADCLELSLVTESMAADRRDAEYFASVPASGAIWWRMQMRVERESKETAARTVRRAHSAVVLATLGALAVVLSLTSLLGAAWSWLTSALPRANELATLLPAAPSLTIVVLAAVSLAVITPVVVYLAVAEE